MHVNLVKRGKLMGMIGNSFVWVEDVNMNTKHVRYTTLVVATLLENSTAQEVHRC